MTDLLEEHSNPARVVAVDTGKGWSRDVPEEMFRGPCFSRRSRAECTLTSRARVPKGI
jgi:hypothetical protein